MRYIQKTDENGNKRYFLVKKYEYIRRIHSKPRKEHPRIIVLRMLGNKCSNPNCLVFGGCVDIRCLQIDHINGGGRKQIKNMKNSYRMFSYYVRHPEETKKDLQVLCSNCNWIKVHEKREFYRKNK